MARANKKTKARTTSASAAAKKKAPAPKAARADKAKAAGSEPGSDVEARWNEYWQCRTALEAAVTAVREAQARLADAKAEEKERRRVFDQTKNALRDLLEVEPASSASPSASTRSLFDAGTRLGVVEPEAADDDDTDEAEDA